MAFMGIFMMWLGIILIVLGVCFFNGLVFLIISLVMKHKAKKNPIVKEDGTTKIKRGYRIPGVISFIFFLPIILFVGFIAYVSVTTSYKEAHSLSYQVMSNQYDKAEKMLKKGQTPDCSFDSNDPVNDKENTLLILMCECGGFVNLNEYTDYDDDMNSYIEEDRIPIDTHLDEDEKRMMKLLIDHGADLEAKSKYDVDNGSELCLHERTPLLIAAASGNYQLVKFLIDEGADINARDDRGLGIVETIAEELDDDSGYEMLQYVVEHGAPTDGVTNSEQDAAYLSRRHDKDFKNDKIREYLKEIGE